MRTWYANGHDIYVKPRSPEDHGILFAADIQAFAAKLYADFELRHDGAEDSSTRWMGEYLETLKVLSEGKP